LSSTVEFRYHDDLMKSFLLLLFVASASAISVSVQAIDITVTSTADTGAGSLREALAAASTNDEIIFAPALDGAVLRLTSGELVVDAAVGIDASNLPLGITISGEGTFRVFHVQTNGVVFDSLTIANGQAFGGTPSAGASGGGGVFVPAASQLTMVRCTVRNCRAGDGFPTPTFNYGGLGGGIYSQGTLSVNDSTIHSNAAGDGVTTGVHDGDGGVGGAIFQSNSGSLAIRNSTIVNNKAGDGKGDTGLGGRAGAIYSQAPTTILNTTISQNACGSGGSGDPVQNGEGGGLFLASGGGTLNITNTIIAGNFAGPAGSPPAESSDITLVSTTVTTSGVNLIGIGEGGSSSFPASPSPGAPNANGDLVGTSADPISAKLRSLADNGGPTLTALPMPDSPAIEPVGGDMISTLTFDQRGFDRYFPDFVDIGAVEFNPQDQARLDAEAADAAAARAAANALAAQQSSLLSKIKKLKKKAKSAKRGGKAAKAKRLKKKVKKLSKKLRSL